MIVTFSIIPVGSGSSLGDKVAEVLKIVDASGLPYKVNPMGTVVEGEWDEIFGLIRKCHLAVLKKERRIYTTIAVDDRKGRNRQLERKVLSLEKRIGRPLKK